MSGSRPPLRDDLALMDGYHSPQLDVPVRLNTNEAPEPPPDGFTEALAAALEGIAWNRYPDRSASALRAAIAAAEGEGLPVGIDADQVVVANGSNEVLQTLCLTYGGPGRTAVTFEPTYALHSHIARIAGTRVHSGARAEDFTLDLGEVERVLMSQRPAITFVCSPNNPTGGAESPETIRAVLAMVEEVGGLLVVDEAYGQFSAHSALELLDDDRPLVVTRTFSKTWSAAALRLGHAIGPRWLGEDTSGVLLPYHLDAVKQVAGRIALRFAAEMRERVAHLTEERGRVATALEGLEVDSWPSEANYILFRPRAVEGAELWQRLVDRGVLVRNCASWPGLEGCLRVTIGNPGENTAFLGALAASLA
ncbi:MAG: aminotransferase class I/II-fold pyridoxal phosphate-dependent enzyme [Microthrixaceae bacterium]|nr:aminotransferase class I/II-fold pyridoxal phosphate-dependent enzyme [Microthrixaceae bacterium]